MSLCLRVHPYTQHKYRQAVWEPYIGRSTRYKIRTKLLGENSFLLEVFG